MGQRSGIGMEMELGGVGWGLGWGGVGWGHTHNVLDCITPALHVYNLTTLQYTKLSKRGLRRCSITRHNPTLNAALLLQG